MNTYSIGHGTPLANPYTSLGTTMPAFHKVNTHAEAISIYETYLRRMLDKEYQHIVEAMEEVAEIYMTHGSVVFTYENSEEGHGDIIVKIIKEVIES